MHMYSLSLHMQYEVLVLSRLVAADSMISSISCLSSIEVLWVCTSKEETRDALHHHYYYGCTRYALAGLRRRDA